MDAVKIGSGCNQAGNNRVGSPIFGAEDDDVAEWGVSLTAWPFVTRGDCGCNRNGQLALSSAGIASDTGLLSNCDPSRPEPLDMLRLNLGSAPADKDRPARC